MVLTAEDHQLMRRCIANAEAVRGTTAPNPWVGAVLVAADGSTFDGATQPPGGPHAERTALNAATAAGVSTVGATMYTTLEPCSFEGRTGACSQALIDAGVARVVVGVGDPDPQVSGNGHDQLRAAGVEVDVGAAADEVTAQLRPYLHQRRTGRPWVVLKLATSIDGRTAAPDGTSQWITGDAARVDAHRLRARCDTILVGAGTVRADDPSLTVRHVDGPDPRRVVLGAAPPDAKVRPCVEVSGEIGEVLNQLGAEGVVDLMIEGGANVAAQFHASGLVDEYVFYVAPVLFGGNDARPLFDGAGAPTIEAVWRGGFHDVEQVGNDLRVTILSQPD